MFDGYVACVDWPAAAYWPEISAAYPHALVLLSTRASAEEWFKSASQTIFTVPTSPAGSGEFDEHFFKGIMSRFTLEIHDPAAAMAAYEAHNERVRASVPAERLVEWRTGDGWRPLCAALGVPEPDEPFPHVNTTEMFRERQAHGRA